ncbi:hypothetical protein AB3Y40_12140 [Yoonia sp. R2331]|uniref:hypothetical protein n=1 Tax=Yoonia sp. R2331 TaxID=3237238 RepID=UPI0034E40F5A
MKVSELIDQPVGHAHDPALKGEIKDVMFDLPVTQVQMFLIEMMGKEGSAPLLVTADSVDLAEGAIKLRGDPDEMRQKLQDIVARTAPLIDLTTLPNVVVGPFGNAISPSMMAALFNRRQGRDLTALPNGDPAAVWFSELSDLPVDCHVSRVARITDVLLEGHGSGVRQIVCGGADDTAPAVSNAELTITRNAQYDLTATASASP